MYTGSKPIHRIAMADSSSESTSSYEVSEHDSDHGELILSFESSSFSEGGNDDSVPLGAQPYMFEPEYSSDESDIADVVPQAEPEDRIGTTDWCSCGNCCAMETQQESLCCTEVPQVTAVKEQGQGDGCIINHRDFPSVCENISVLDTAYYAYRQYENVEMDPSPERYRYIAYRQLVRWCWGWLGKDVRVPLPACVVSMIRTTFPTENGQYTGYKD